MSYSFEQIRAALKQFNFEENIRPPKIVVAGKDFLDIAHKKRSISQFIIGVKEYPASDQPAFDRFLHDLATETAQTPLSFPFEDKESLETVISDFEDYFDIKLGNKVFQRPGNTTGSGELRYCLVIVVCENDCYYEPPT